MKKDRGKVWLGVANLVVNEKGQWLVVKKKYSGLKGMWSLPAGFVQEGEVVEQAAKREVLEETGLETNIIGLIGFRSGVIRNEISDNMAIFISKLVDEKASPVAQEIEIEEIEWLSPEEIITNELSSTMLLEMAKSRVDQHILPTINGTDPGKQFGYTEYQLFFKKNK